mgnify:CR=1 FL=1
MMVEGPVRARGPCLCTKRRSRSASSFCFKRLLHVPKGKKEEYKAKAEKQGKSLNQYIIECIEKVGPEKKIEYSKISMSLS